MSILRFVNRGGRGPLSNRDKAFQPFGNKDGRRDALTFPEVLIAMVILGIIAILTIPLLYNVIREKDLVSKYLKMNNTLENAYKTTMAVSGFDLSKTDISKFKPLFEEQLNVFSTKAQGCKQDICLVDGSSFDYVCETTDELGNTFCTELLVDSNYLEKKPNAHGRDQFRYLITKNGLVPQGEYEMCGLIDGGLDCGPYIIAHHKLYDGIVEHCKTYASGALGGCDVCDDSFKKVNGGFGCEKINDPACADDGWAEDKCVKCDSGHIPADGTCVAIATVGCSEKSTTSEACALCEPHMKRSSSGLCEAGDDPNCYMYTGENNASIVTGSTSKDACAVCEPGSSINPSTNRCEKAAAGTYSDGYFNYGCGTNLISEEGASECTSCGTGKCTSDHIHCIDGIQHCVTQVCGSSCSECEPGYRPNGNSCVECSAGTFSDDGGSCRNCADNMIAPNSKATSCSQCPGNQISHDHVSCYAVVQNCANQTNGTCAACGLGYKLENNACAICGAGTYGNGTSCVACAGNTYSNGNGFGSCLGCPGGQTANANHTGCYTPVAGCNYDANGNCVSCQAGYYRNGNSCSICWAGTYGNGTSCITCQGNTYSNGNGWGSCAGCPGGQTANANHTGCYTPVAGCNYDANGNCGSCQAGYYRNGNSCSACWPGTYGNGWNCISCSGNNQYTDGYGWGGCGTCPSGWANAAHTGCISCQYGSAGGSGNDRWCYFEENGYRDWYGANNRCSQLGMSLAPAWVIPGYTCYWTNSNCTKRWGSSTKAVSCGVSLPTACFQYK